MYIVKSVRRCLTGGNFHFFAGIIIGLFLHANLTYLNSYCSEGPGSLDDDFTPKFERADVFQRPLTPRLVRPGGVANTSGTRRPTAKVVRPRYYSTELGIREKLFVGILTSEEKISLQAVHINQTITHLVDKVKFFITAQRKLKTQFNLSGIVGFTDTRFRYRPFQVIKYIGDTFIQDYDYYFLMNDFNYLNAEILKDIVRKISVKNDVYLGKIVKDGSYCDLDAGILLSNSAMKAMKEHLDWCVINAVTDDHSENIGRCIHHSIGLSCQDTIQNQSIRTYKLKHFSVQGHMDQLREKNDFEKAVTIYPITEAVDFYTLHIHFSKQKLIEFDENINALSSSNFNDSWPPGIRPGAIPASRFDLPMTYYFNMSHMFFPDDFTNIKTHTSSDIRDIEHIIEKITKRVLSNKNLSYLRLINGYRTFDMSRGIDYTLDLGFRDLESGKEIIKRFEVAKPLSSVEFIPVPYVTENSRVAILLLVEENDTVYASEFLENYSNNIVERKEKVFLMLVLLYQYESENKGDEDPFNPIKIYSTKINEKFHNEDSKIAWVSIRLPKSSEAITLKNYPSLDFAVVDLSLRKIGLDSIVFVTDVYSELTMDFLNRVKMNTIENFQIFNVIPFRQFNPVISQIDQLDVNKNSGQFDDNEFRYISFYGKDYVAARKIARGFIPIIKYDSDIENILTHPANQNGNIFKMFVEYSNDIHCMRGTDMSFKLKYRPIYLTNNYDFNGLSRRLFFGNKGQIANYLMSKDLKFQGR